MFGNSVSSGDVNGDGRGDIVVGAGYFDNGQEDEGAAYLYLSACSDLADADGDGFCAAEECDDTNPMVHPGAVELCDGLDNDCSGAVADDELDGDGDGESVCQGDCDDTNPGVFTARIETCNGLDDNCDGLGSDELNVDGDRFMACNGDCDDTSTWASPDLPETCGDAVDNDCDGSSDEGCDGPDQTGCTCRVGGGAGAPLLALAFLLLIIGPARARAPSGRAPAARRAAG
jgi:hypothetical protein